MRTVLVTGASRGIGLEFCKQYAKQGWQVFACCRNPEQAVKLNNLVTEYSYVKVYKMDVIERSGIDALANQIKDSSIDLIIANAGVYGDSSGHGFGNLDYVEWINTLETNVLGVVKVAEAFLPNLKRSNNNPCIAVLSSQMGSIDDNSSGGSILYRSSKAALNAAMKSLSIDCQNDNIGVLIFHPGWVKTDMGGPHALIDPETSVTGMVKQIGTFRMSQTGRFIKYDGTQLPW